MMKLTANQNPASRTEVFFFNALSSAFQFTKRKTSTLKIE